jgi:hypothetical protein
VTIIPEKYISAAITNESAVVVSARSSPRNHTLNRSAFKLGTIPGMTTDTAVNALMLASKTNGYVKDHGEKITRQVIESGLKNGQRSPRVLPVRRTRPFSSQSISTYRQPEAPRPTIAKAEAPSIEIPPTSNALPASTPPDEKGDPRLYRYGEEGPPVESDEIRRHVYKVDGQARRIKIKVKTKPGRMVPATVFLPPASHTSLAGKSLSSPTMMKADESTLNKKLYSFTLSRRVSGWFISRSYPKRATYLTGLL